MSNGCHNTPANMVTQASDLPEVQAMPNELFESQVENKANKAERMSSLTMTNEDMSANKSGLKQTESSTAKCMSLPNLTIEDSSRDAEGHALDHQSQGHATNGNASKPRESEGKPLKPEGFNDPMLKHGIDGIAKPDVWKNGKLEGGGVSRAEPDYWRNGQLQGDIHTDKIPFRFK